MKWFSTMMMALVLSTTAQAEVDFGQANPVLKAISDRISATDDMLLEVLPQFDKQYSNLEQEKLKYDLQGSFAPPWSPSDVARVSASTTWNTDRVSAQTGIRVGFRAEVLTDTLAFSRYSGELALRKSGSHGTRFGARIVTSLNQLAAVKTMDELYDQIVAGQALALEIVRAKLAEGLGYDIPEWTAVAQAYERTEVKAVRENGKVVAIEISNPDADGFLSRKDHFGRTAHAGAVEVSLTGRRIGATVAAYSDQPVAKLDLLKADFDRILNGAIQGNPADRDFIDSRYREGLIAFKKVLRGQNQY